jgi:hypothetical protein
MSLKTVLIQDARIANITDEEHFAVQDGASQSTFQSFPSNTASASSIVWNIQVPSENIVIDRHLLMQSTVTLTLNISGSNGTGINNDQDVDDLVFDYGMTDSLQAFPLNALCVSQQMTINNATISQATRDIMPMILRMTDKRKLNKQNSMCPSLVDAYYADFNSGLGCINNVLSGYNNQSLDEDYTPRGAFDLKILSVTHTFSDNVSGAQTDTSLIAPAYSINNKFIVVVQFTTTEPFVALSPWINTVSQNNSGLVGVNTISCNLNIDSTCSRVWSTMTKNIYSISLGGTVDNVAIQPFIDTKLLFNFLSLQPEQYKKISSKCIVPYLDMPRYLTSSISSGQLTPNSTATLTSNALQLSQIPDLILVCVRKPMSSQTWTDPNFFLKINSISVSFNNTSGILSSANAQQLYNISLKNGSSQSYYEFSGYATNNRTGVVNSNGQAQLEQLEPEVAAALAGQPVKVPTTGSMLVLSPAYDFNLPSYLSASSLGQYNLQFTINVTNQTTQTFIPEICVITVNSGLFTTQLGSSIINTGLLTKEQVLKTKEQEKPDIDTNDFKTYIGGVFGNMGSSNVMKLFRKHAHIPSGDNIAQDAVIESGVHGSGISGGRISRLKKHIR